MANLTIKVDEHVLRKARIKVRGQGTSVNALRRSFLEQYVRDVEARKKAIMDILALSRSSRAARRGRRWTSDELREREM